MVWFVDRHAKYSTEIKAEKYNLGYDRIIQAINIMYSLYQENIYDACDISFLISSGVHIFNVDLTVNDKTFYESIRAKIMDVKTLFKTNSQTYLRPITFSVTMSIYDDVEIDKRVDFVVLKDVQTQEQVNEFKERNTKSSLPMLLWISKYCSKPDTELIKISDGIVLDFTNECSTCIEDFIKISKEQKTPIFYYNSDVFENVEEYRDGKRKLVSIAHDINKNHMDGVIIATSEKLDIYAQSKIVTDVIEALSITENRDMSLHYKAIQMQVKTPQLSPFSMAISASLAVQTSEARFIIVLTASGKSAQILSVTLPLCPIIAVTTRESTSRLMHLYRKVIPLYYEARGRRVRYWHQECQNRVIFASEFAYKIGLLASGSRSVAVVLLPSEEDFGYCNSIQIITLPFTS